MLDDINEKVLLLDCSFLNCLFEELGFFRDRNIDFTFDFAVGRGGLGKGVQIIVVQMRVVQKGVDL